MRSQVEKKNFERCQPTYMCNKMKIGNKDKNHGHTNWLHTILLN